MVKKFAASGALIVALAFVGLVVATLLMNRPVRFPLDDAYITIANAHQLLTGAVDDYGQRRPTGATSLVHLLLLTGMGTVFNLPAASLVLAFAAAGLYVTGLYRLLHTISANAIVATLGSLGGLMGGFVWYQMMNGLETGLAMAAVVWAAYLAQYPDDRRKQLVLAAIIGTLPFIRPELALLGAALVGSAIIRLRHSPSAMLAPALYAGAMVTLVAGVAWLATGEIVPQTVGAKVAFFAESGLPLATRLAMAAGAVVTSPLAPVLLGLLFVPGMKEGWAFVGFALLYWVITAWSLPGGLWHNAHRYLYIFWPLGLAGWAVLSARTDLLRGKTRLIAAIGACFLIAGFFVSGWRDYRDSLSVTKDQEDMSRWAQANLPGNSRILIHDAGYFGWSANFPLVDLVGLKSPGSIAVHRRLTLPSVGAQRGVAISEIAHRGRVTHAIILDQPFWRDIVCNLRDAGWQVEPLHADPDGLYRLYRLTPPA